jgi:hypothetical protein
MEDQYKDIKLSVVEKVLFNATYEFATTVEKLSHEEATKKAMDKVIAKRALALMTRFKH